MGRPDWNRCRAAFQEGQLWTLQVSTESDHGNLKNSFKLFFFLQTTSSSVLVSRLAGSASASAIASRHSATSSRTETLPSHSTNAGTRPRSGQMHDIQVILHHPNFHTTITYIFYFVFLQRKTLPEPQTRRNSGKIAHCRQFTAALPKQNVHTTRTNRSI